MCKICQVQAESKHNWPRKHLPHYAQVCQLICIFSTEVCVRCIFTVAEAGTTNWDLMKCQKKKDLTCFLIPILFFSSLCSRSCRVFAFQPDVLFVLHILYRSVWETLQNSGIVPASKLCNADFPFGVREPTICRHLSFCRQSVLLFIY